MNRLITTSYADAMERSVRRLRTRRDACPATQVWLATGYTDMRKGLPSLSGTSGTVQLVLDWLRGRASKKRGAGHGTILRHDPEFLAQVEAVIKEAESTNNIKVAAFSALFTRRDVVEALRSIQQAAQSERLEGKDLIAMMPQSEDALANGVAAAIVAAAGATAAAALV